jgi:hypothetical protein
MVIMDFGDEFACASSDAAARLSLHPFSDRPIAGERDADAKVKSSYACAEGKPIHCSVPSRKTGSVPNRSRQARAMFSAM